MEELLNQLAEARGLPASLVERSAQARAQATGQSTEDVLREWAEEEGIAAATAEPSSPPAETAEVESPPTSEPPAETPAPVEAAPVAVEGGLSGAELLDAVAVARGMPAPLVERSAEARAKKTGATTDAVLQEWAVEAGIDVGGVPAPAPRADAVAEVAPPVSEAAPSEAPPAEAPSTPSAPAVAAGGLAGAALLDAVAEARGMPASLVERSAGARAKKTGTTTDAVLREWAAEAGIDAGAAQEAQAPAEAASAPPAVAEPAAAVTQPEPADDRPRVEVVEPVTEAVAAPVVDTDDHGKRRRYPVWLAAALVIIPLVAVLYLVVVPNGPRCGSAGQLAVDPETGQAVGCDGAAYGVGEMNAFAAGEAVYQASCAVCHASDGSGGAGPAMSGGAVLVAFPEDTCVDHIKWVALGSTGWPESTYGANGKPVAGGMPGFETSLLEEEIAQVVLYERVAFGGLEVEAAEASCGLGEAAEDGEAVTASD